MTDTSRLAGLAIDQDERRGAGSGVWLGVGVLVVVAVAAGAWWVVAHRPPVVTTAAARAVTVGGHATVLNASGYVTARRKATVSSKVTGKVLEVLIEEGMVVADGQVLARLDPVNDRLALDLASAQLEATRTGRDEIQVRIREAGLDLGRVERLVGQQVVSQADLDGARAEVDSLEARLASQERQVAVAERQLALARQQLTDTEIRAPFAGVVVSKDAQPGEMISPVSAGGGFTRTGIGTVVDMTSLEIEVDVNESYINRVVAGQPVVATLDSYPEWKIPARVIAIVPTADRQKATVRVRIAIDAADPRILPDMGVKVAFQGGGEAPATAAAAAPRSAVRDDGGAAVVLVVQGERVERRAVRLGPVEGEEATVTAGLASGEVVVVGSPVELADGDRVEAR